MAFHAIKAGEGDTYISAGVETVSRFSKGSSDSLPDTRNPLFAGAHQRSERASAGEAGPWHDPRDDGLLPDLYVAMGETAENVAQVRGISRQEQDEFGARSQNLAEKAIADGFWQREITPVTMPDGTVVTVDDGPRPGTTIEKLATLAAGVPPGRHRDRGELLPAQRRRRRGYRDERRQGGQRPLIPATSCSVSWSSPA